MIARHLNVGKTMVKSAIKFYAETGSTENRIRRPKPRKTTITDDRAMVRFSKKNPFLSSVQVLNLIQPQLSQKISNRTVQRRLAEKGLHGFIAQRKPHASKFNLFGSDGKCYVHLPRNKSLDPKYTIKTIKHGGYNIMVWAAFSCSGVGPLVRVTWRIRWFHSRKKICQWRGFISTTMTQSTQREQWKPIYRPLMWLNPIENLWNNKYVMSVWYVMRLCGISLQSIILLSNSCF